MTRMWRTSFLVAALLCAVTVVGLGCGDGDDDAAGAASSSPTPTLPPAATPTEGADYVTLAGTVIVINEYPDGHPRQVGIAIDPTDDTVWTVDGLEHVYFWDGPLGRELEASVGRHIEVRGPLRTGNLFQRTIFPRSYRLDDQVVFADPAPPVSETDSTSGTVVVLERYEDGHPRVLGVEADGVVVRLEESNKSRELRYRIGGRVLVRGLVGDNGSMRVAAYEDLDGIQKIDAGDGFRMSFLAGGFDAAGNFMGGVEIDTLAAFDGRIFAGVSYRKNTQEDSPDPLPPGAQVLVLDAPDARWRVDFTVSGDEAGNAPRFVFLKRVAFSTDAAGAPLVPPVELLAGVGGNGELYLRSPGEPAEWVKTGLPELILSNTTLSRRPDARSVITHTDTVTGITHLFVGGFLGGRRGDANGVYRGSYAPELPGRIAWLEEPEYRYTASAAEPWRVMGLTETADAVYASIGKILLRRQDGVEPEWDEVYRDPLPSAPDSLREATAVRGADGSDVLLFSIEGPNSRIVSVDPGDGHRAEDELLPLVILGPAVTGLAAYNGPVTRALADGTDAAILGLEVFRSLQLGPGVEDPDLGRFYDWTDGLVLWREPDRNYRLNRIVDATLEVHPPMIGARAILGHSPFEGEEDIVYLGGFDHNGQLFHNTAWIVKVHVEDLRQGLAVPR